MGGSEAADWIAAIGQAVGAVGTFAAVVVALLIARRDGRRAEKDRLERETAQARLVTTRVDEHWQEQIIDGESSQLVVRNNSEHAIADLYVVKVEVEGRNLRWIPEESALDGVDVVASGSSATFPGRWERPAGAAAGSDKGTVNAVNARVQFVDSGGVWWQRVGNDDVIRSETPAARRAALSWEKTQYKRTTPSTTPTDARPPAREEPTPGVPGAPSADAGQVDVAAQVDAAAYEPRRRE